MSELRIERTVKYATNVDDLPEAWTFVMSKIEELGPDPHIEIKPLWTTDIERMRDDDKWKRVFEVTVSGMVEEPAAVPEGEVVPDE